MSGSGVAAAPYFAADLARHGERPALISPTATVSYAELAQRIDEACAGLDVQGQRALVQVRPSSTVEFVVAWLAALTGGHATLLTADDALAAAYRCSVQHDNGAWCATGATAPELHPDLRLLLSTSGSTGSPKLVRLSETNLHANAEAIAAYLGLADHDVALTTLPLDYCYGLSVLHSHLAVGASVVLDHRSVTEPGLWATARAHGVTSFAGVPHTFELLAAAGWPDLPTLRRVTQAGGAMAPEQVRELAAHGAADGWDFVVMYGQTEATARMAYLPPHLASTRPEAVGVPIPGGSFRLQPCDDVTDPGVGELIYSGPNVMLGYAEHPRDLARGADLTELRTGDLARIRDGLVEIVGRRSRIAKLFGQRIDLEHVQLLLGAAGHDVTCVESNDGHHLVVACSGSPAPWAVAEIAAAAAHATGLPGHAVHAVSLDVVPRLPNGKVDYQAVAELRPAEEGESPGSMQHLVDLYGRVLGRLDVTPDDSFTTLGGDSLSYVELAVRLEQHLGAVPIDWPTRTIAELTASRPAGARRRMWAWIDTSIALRAAAITLVVGTHTNVWVILGGAHILLAVMGANFARFLLTDEGPRARLSRMARATGRIAVPAVVWIGGVTLLTGEYPWQTVFLLNDLLGPPRWAEPEFFYWFLDVAVVAMATLGALMSIPRVLAWERRHRFAVALTVFALTLIPRLVEAEIHYRDDVLHSVVFVAWLFAGGWAGAAARTTWQRLAVSALMVAGIWDFTGEPQRDHIITVGVLLLIWLPRIPWPRPLVGLTGTIASASLYIYLTHWKVYPWFETRWPLGGLLASLVVGVVVWQVVNRATALTRSGFTPNARRLARRSMHQRPPSSALPNRQEVS